MSEIVEGGALNVKVGRSSLLRMACFRRAASALPLRYPHSFFSVCIISTIISDYIPYKTWRQFIISGH